MYWKDSFFDALFPIDNRVISLPYCLKRPSKRDEYLDVLIPNRKKVNVELAFKILEQNLPNTVKPGHQKHGRQPLPPKQGGTP